MKQSIRKVFSWRVTSIKIGHIDKDGYLYIVDRKKNIIRHPNQYVFPAEIENFLLKSSKIRSVCVIGVPFDEATEMPAAFIVRQDDSDITEQDIYELIEGNYLHDRMSIVEIERKSKEHFRPTDFNVIRTLCWLKLFQIN